MFHVHGEELIAIVQQWQQVHWRRATERIRMKHGEHALRMECDGLEVHPYFLNTMV
jgi:hypothetical protein